MNWDNSMEENANASYFQVEFYSKHKEWSDKLPSTPFAIPGIANEDMLNSLLIKAIEEQADLISKTTFDFIINGLLLRVPLFEFVDQHQLNSESVIKVECTVRDPAPTPDRDLQHEDWISSVKTAGKYIISGCYNGNAYLWSKNGKLIGITHGNSGSIKCLTVVSCSESALRFITGGQDQTLTLWKTDLDYNKNDLKSTICTIYRGHGRSVECVAANRDGTRLISGSFDSTLKVWTTEEEDQMTLITDMKKRKKCNELASDTATRTPMVTLAGHRDAIVSVCWSFSDSAEVLTASWDHSLVFWDLELAGQKNCITGTKSFTSAAFSPVSGHVIATSVDSHVRLYDPRSTEGSLVKSTFVGHTGWTSCASWSPDNEKHFISGSFDSVLKLWDIRSPSAALFDLTGHSDRILACHWSTDRSMILSGGVDGAVKTFRTDANGPYSSSVVM